MKQLSISFSAMSPQIGEQLSDFVVDQYTIDYFESIDYALTMLFLHGYINKGQVDEGRKKLLKEIGDELSIKTESTDTGNDDV